MRRARSENEVVIIDDDAENDEVVELGDSSDDDDCVVVMVGNKSPPTPPPPPLKQKCLNQQSVSQSATPASTQQQQHAPLQRKPLLLSSTSLARGWLVHRRIPSHLAVAKYETGLKALLAVKPEEHGQVMINGSAVDVPRFQKPYLRDYNFSGMTHKAEQVLPACIAELLDWANSLIVEHWLPLDDTEHVMARLKTTGALPPELANEDDEHSSSIVEEATRKWMQKTWRFNGCLVNYYMDGTHYIGAHQDDESQLWPCSPIFSLSLGQTRVFRIRELLAATPPNKERRDIDLPSGSLLVMGGRMQENFTHEVPKVAGKTAFINPRVNITFRCFKN